MIRSSRRPKARRCCGGTGDKVSLYLVDRLAHVELARPGCSTASSCGRRSIASSRARRLAGSRPGTLPAGVDRRALRAAAGTWEAHCSFALRWSQDPPGAGTCSRASNSRQEVVLAPETDPEAAAAAADGRGATLRHGQHARHHPQARRQGFTYRDPHGARSSSARSWRGCAGWRSRRHGPPCGSARTRAAISRRPDAMRAGASSTATTRSGGRSAMPTSSTGSWCSRGHCRRSGRVDADLRRPGLPRERVLATVVRLLETTLIRVGNEYARDNKSFGLTTIRHHHVEVNGSTIEFEFRGKGGKMHKVSTRDRRLARIVRACHELPGQELFKYIDEAAKRRDVDSADVNAYLQEISGEPFTAKDFRTWAGTVLASLALSEFESFDAGGGQAQRHARHRAGRQQSGQHDRRVPQELHPSGHPRFLPRRQPARVPQGSGRGDAARGAGRPERRGGGGARLPAAAAEPEVDRRKKDRKPPI